MAGSNFINPYNFVPLGFEADKKTWEEKITSKRVSGKIEYTLETLTPLFIPNTSNDRVFEVSNEVISTEDKTEKYHKSFEFFSYTDLTGCKDLDKNNPEYDPVIPGSEIRGAVRSLYETLTDSCLSAIDTSVILSKRTPERFKPGILEWSGNEWILYMADDYLYRTNKRNDFSVKSFKGINIVDGSEVFFLEDIISAPDRPWYAKPLVSQIRLGTYNGQNKQTGMKEGYLVKGESGPELGKPSRGAKCSDCPQKTKNRCSIENGKDCYLIEKHCAHVFEKAHDRNSRVRKHLRRFTEQEIIQYKKQIESVLRLSHENGKSLYEEYSGTWKKFKKREQTGIPVYYSYIEGEDIFYFSPACITREVYIKTLGDIIGKYNACSKETKVVCPACSLFGTINGGLHKSSRIRFSDLILKNSHESVFSEVVMLPELSTPKIASTELYIQRPDIQSVLNWTYEYYVVLGKDNVPEIKSYTAVISGRKFYWHSLTAARTMVYDRQEKIEKTERNKSVRPVNKGVSFKGVLYFDDISEEELRELIAIMNMSEDSSGRDKYAIKLGAAKPLGFGSAALRVDSVKLRSVRKDEQNQTVVFMPDEQYQYNNADLSVFNRMECLKMLEVEALKAYEKEAVLSYPKQNETDEGFAWFVSNRKAIIMDRKKKSLDIPRTTNGPGDRRQVVYSQYMEPMNPVLKSNLVSGVDFTQRGDSKKRSERNGSGYNQSREGSYQKKNTTDTKFQIGKKYAGRVLNHHENGWLVYVELENGVRTSFRDNGSIPDNTNVKLKYKGKNEKGYDDWEEVSEYK